MCCNTGSSSKWSIARRARFMGFCKSRLKIVRGGQILKPWRDKVLWNQIRLVSNPTNDLYTKRTQIVDDLQRANCRRQAAAVAPMFLFVSLKRDAEVFHVRNSSVDCNNFRHLSLSLSFFFFAAFAALSRMIVFLLLYYTSIFSVY